MGVRSRGRRSLVILPGTGSGEDLMEDATAGDGDGAVALAADFGGGIDAEEMEHGGGEVIGSDEVFGGIGGVLIGGAEGESAFHPAAGEEDGVAVGPVIAADVSVDARGAAEFAHPEDEGGVEQAAFVEIREQGGQGLIHEGQVPALDDGEHAGVVETVGVPAAVLGVLPADALVKVDGDEFDADLDEASGEETGLAVSRAAKTVAYGIGFVADLEGVAQGLGIEQGKGLVVVGVETARDRSVFEQSGLAVDELHHLASGGESGGINAGGQAEFREGEVGGIGIASDEERIVLFAEETGVLAGGDGAVADDMGKGDGSGEFGSGGRGEFVDEGTVGGEEFLGILEPDVVEGWSVTSEGVVGGGIVVPHGVMDGSDETNLVHDPGHAGETFIDPQAGDIRWDGFVETADAFGGIGFHVEGFELAGAAPLEEEDDGAGAGSDATEGGLGGDLAMEESGQGEAEHAETPDAECGAPVEDMTDLIARGLAWGGVGVHGDQWRRMNSLELRRAQAKSSRVARRSVEWARRVEKWSCSSGPGGRVRMDQKRSSMTRSAESSGSAQRASWLSGRVMSSWRTGPLMSWRAWARVEDSDRSHSQVSRRGGLPKASRKRSVGVLRPSFWGAPPGS